MNCEAYDEPENWQAWLVSVIVSSLPGKKIANRESLFDDEKMSLEKSLSLIANFAELLLPAKGRMRAMMQNVPGVGGKAEAAKTVVVAAAGDPWQGDLKTHVIL